MSESRANVRAFWDTHAGRYDDRFDEESGDAHALRARLDTTLRLVGDGPGAALDAGMGPGRLCAELDARGWTVFGVDASSEMVSLARARLPAAAGRLVEGSIESLPFPDSTFDRATATGVLEYADVPAALAELARVLRPGALAVVSYPNPWAIYRTWKAWVWYPAVRALRRLPNMPKMSTPRAAARIAPKAFEQLLRDAGFASVEPRLMTSAMPIVAPLDTLFPKVTARLARRMEHTRTAALVLRTQVVYTARKPTADVSTG